MLGTFRFLLGEYCFVAWNQNLLNHRNFPVHQISNGQWICPLAVKGIKVVVEIHKAAGRDVAPADDRGNGMDQQRNQPQGQWRGDGGVGVDEEPVTYMAGHDAQGGRSGYVALVDGRGNGTSQQRNQAQGQWKGDGGERGFVSEELMTTSALIIVEETIHFGNSTITTGITVTHFRYFLPSMIVSLA